MPGVSFSLTERVIVDPVLSLRASFPQVERGQTPELKAIVWHAFQSKVLARIVCIFTSAIAAADATTHLLVGAYKGAYLRLAERFSLAPATWSKADVHAHFQRAAFFGKLTIIGSLRGVFSPDFLRPSRYVPSAPSADSDAPEAVKQWTLRVVAEGIPVGQLKRFWSISSLENKHWFVQIFSRNTTEDFQNVRLVLADIVYRPIVPLTERQVQWLSPQEIDQKIPPAYEHSFNQAFFFHATSKAALEGILKSKKIEVRHEKAFRGAFVSTRPEREFGRCILAFRRNIERLSSLSHGFLIQNNSAYWAGFSHDIPVTDTTLAYIILDRSDNAECRELEGQCQAWAQRPIDVISLDQLADKLDTIQDLDMGIPNEWPDEGEGIGQKILNTLKATATRAPLKVRTLVAQRLSRHIQQVGHASQPFSHASAEPVVRTVQAQPQHRSLQTMEMMTTS
jgi:hypothetical protein